MRERDEGLGVFATEKPESLTLGKTLNYTYQVNCSSW